jgi:lipoprotein-anchoring transpeptidase ErfK/SrfK
MVDYYSILWRAVSAPAARDARRRRGIYDRARQTLVSQMRARRPPATNEQIRDELMELEAAIAQVEAELTGAKPAAAAAPERDRNGEIPAQPSDAASGGLSGMALRRAQNLPARSWVILAVVVAALAAGAFEYLATRAPKPAPLAVTSETPAAPAMPAAPAKTVAPAVPAAPAPVPAAMKDGDLAPGTDGGSSDADLSYVFRRQPVFYRTLQPIGTVIIDMGQHFLYLIQPNNVALRYGIGVGEQCADLLGLRKVATMAEWPQWQPPPELIARKLAKPSALPGGPGNPFGARILQLDDGKSGIHGTNAPKTIGTAAIYGCIRLVNDDIVDLYGRVKVSTPVIVSN